MQCNVSGLEIIIADRNCLVELPSGENSRISWAVPFFAKHSGLECLGSISIVNPGQLCVNGGMRSGPTWKDGDCLCGVLAIAFSYVQIEEGDVQLRDGNWLSSEVSCGKPQSHIVATL